MTETSRALADELTQDDPAAHGEEGAAEVPAGEEGEEPAPEAAQATPDEDEESEAEGRLGPGADLDDDELLRRLAALLFASSEPLSIGRLVSLLERPPSPRVKVALETLGSRLAGASLPIEVRGLRGGYTLMTSADVGTVVGRLARGAAIERISAAALETLSIVAYRQPVTKAEIEAIRGVQAGPVLRALVDRGLVKVTGRADVPGHPLQYGTTPEFLDRFGLHTLEELPRDAELARG
ncbi:MAG: SMC-Scp complex subunit ScpB [Planctomycetota bacterium]|nr:SMC-Scp complex subunit ScpB [Planctomycetota bacterium]